MTVSPVGRPIKAVLIQNATTSPGSPLAQILKHDGDIVVVGHAARGAAAVEMVAQEQPQIVVLDLGSGDDGGGGLIAAIMSRAPTPILVLSAAPSAARAEALAAGALDALTTPASWTGALGAQLRRRVRQVQAVPVLRQRPGDSGAAPPPRQRPGPREHPVVALVASTGGPTALATVLGGLADLAAPVLVVQHLHSDFTRSLCDSLARGSGLPVQIAEHGQLIEPGRVYLAPGDRHLRLATNLRLELGTTPETVHRPSGDELLLSVAAHAGPAGVGVVLTGMGDDGARGLLAVHRCHGCTFAQDESTSAVFGMPEAARRLGGVRDLLPLEAIAPAVRRAVARSRA
jgi:two-component system chemotaxis response regulator CheB